MKKLLLLLLPMLLALPLWAQDAFTVRDIRVEGLQRISAGTVFNYLPVSVGSAIKPQDYPEIVRALFKTGLFTDVSIARDGDVLVVKVVERPAIAEINLDGNKDIATDKLKTALKEAGMAEGRAFDKALLDRVEQELLKQYFSRGKYGVKIDSKVRPLPRNRVAIDIDISEGAAARIRQINIVGNKAFDEDDLLDLFQLTTPGIFTLISKNDQYSKQKLTADIEALRSFYLDRGYLKFNVDSTQVSITPDKKDIYITINITEGDRYSVRDVRVSGNTIVAEDELLKLSTINQGDTFSRSAVAETSQRILDRLGDEGYAFANVNSTPDINDAEKLVDLNFIVDPGKRAFVRRINFTGNVKTRDEVLRREMRQAESSWFSRKDINRSRTRLQRLPYISDVKLETNPVPGTADQVDVNYTVEERPAGSLTFGIGYGQEEGLLLNASVSEQNFAGTGNEVTLVVNNNRADTNYSFSYNNPYYTPDGVSRGFRIAYSQTDAKENNTADYTIDKLIGLVNFGFPLNETDTLRFGVGYEGLDIKTTDATPPEIQQELDQNGDVYHNFKLEGSWAKDSRNRAVFADSGMLNQVTTEIALPGSDSEYYKIDFRHRSYFPVTKNFTFSLKTNLGYGDGYGNTDKLPFFENYFAGGLRTVRGFKANTLGPRYPSNNDPSGGALRVTGGAEVIFPAPFLADSKNFRVSAFVDAGNVFATAGDFDAGEIRYSAGVAGAWLSPLGPLVLSVAKPLNEKNGDETESLQFSFGVPF